VNATSVGVVNVALPMIFALVALVLGYVLYGRRVARWLGVDPSRTTPAVEKNDGVDFVPARPFVLFGHHYASIAAAGPIVGPTVALAYGYVPTWSWILLGVVFIGAMHDMTALFLSVRAGGKSIAEVTRGVMGTTGYVLFLAFAVILCVLVGAAFLDLVAVALTSTYPLTALGLEPSQTLLATVDKGGVPHGVIGGVASTSVIVMTAAAPGLGWLIYRRGASLTVALIVSAVICVASVVVGLTLPLSIDPQVWVWVVAAYCLVAGFIPVWLIIQPRDFTNVQFLYLGIIAMVAGVIACGIGGVTIDAPAFAPADSAATAALGSIWPVLFVTVACGSISGAHALVASGTTAKQVADERHILPIGYGGMLGEALLGVCVTLVILAGLGHAGYQEIVWPVDEHGHLGKGNAALAFAAAIGGSLDKGFGLPTVYGTLFGILLLEGFLVTTTDTIVRLTRHLFEELWNVLFAGAPPAALKNRVLNTGIPLAMIILLVLDGDWKSVWPVFGTANQLLAALTLVTATAWLMAHKRRYLFTALPAAFMVITTVASLEQLIGKHYGKQEWLLLSVDIVLATLAVVVVALAVRRIIAGAGAREPVESA
jgi:carbon starvation protein